MVADDATGIAASFSEMFRTGDVAVFAVKLAPGASAWHNTDHAVADARVSLEAIAALRGLVDDLRLDVVQWEALPSGELLRFVLRGTVRSSGQALEAHNCAVFTIDDTGVTRVDEYVDPTLAVQLGFG